MTKKFTVIDLYLPDVNKLIVQYKDGNEYKTKTIIVTYEAYQQYNEGDRTLIVK